MIQPIKQFRVTRLTISGFKGYADQKTFQFGGMNVISGHMGVGKSSIADAIAFAITGVGFYAGAKIDYLYHQDTRDLLVELEFEDESGKLRTLARHRKDDKMDITLDGVRIGQGDLTTMFGERDLFLSMFNPQYFINVLGSKGRNLLERYLPEVPKAEVLAQLSDQTRALLEKQEFLSAEAYSKQLREQVTDIEKDMFPIGKSDVRAAFMNRGFDMCLAENSPKECSAAVCALLRRPSADEYPTEAAPPGRIIYKDLMMDPLRQRVTMRGSQLSFTALEFKLLYFLASNPSIVFSRELIYERVWRESSLYGSKSVNDLICSIRKKMGLSPKDTDYIKTVKGVGYCFAP